MHTKGEMSQANQLSTDPGSGGFPFQTKCLAWLLFPRVQLGLCLRKKIKKEQKLSTFKAEKKNGLPGPWFSYGVLVAQGWKSRAAELNFYLYVYFVSKVGPVCVCGGGEGLAPHPCCLSSLRRAQTSWRKASLAVSVLEGW